MSDDSGGREAPVELTVLVVVGWVLPLAGYVWGPGEWWAYALWLAIGTALIGLWVRAHPETLRGDGAT